MKKIAFILALVQFLCIFSGVGIYAADVAVIDSLEFQGSKIGVFTEDENIKLDFNFTNKLQAITSYRFEITDVWERQVADGMITIPIGKKSATLNLGKFNVGWYRISLYNKGDNNPLDNYLAFSVLHSPSKRNKYESTPFAGALAGEQDALIREQPELIAKAFADAGITYTRNVGSGWLEKNDPPVKKAFHEYGIDESSYHDGNALRYNLSVSTPEYMAFTSDLFYIYNNWKEISKANHNYAEAIEILNEIDIGFFGTTGTPDNFAAFSKAAAIGIADSSLGNPLAVMNGWATNSTTDFIVWALQNDITKYSAAYNYHTHNDGLTNLSSSVNAANAYGDEYIPVWGTEIGTPVTLNGDEKHIKDRQFLEETGHVVKKVVEHLSIGSSKEFSFLLRPYLENGKNYGYFASPEWLPYPMFSSLSAMTYALGEGIVKGEMANINDETIGVLFDNGSGNDVAVFWSQNQCYVDIYADKVTYMDMVGYEEEKVDEDGDGKIKICLNTDPIYITFNGQSAKENYYPYEYKANTTLEQKDFTVAERVVVQPIWGDVAPNLNRKIGHYVYGDKDNILRLEIYNFNNVAVKGTIDITGGEDLEFNKRTVGYSLEPWSKTEIPLKITLKDKDCGTGTSSYVKFEGKLDSGEILSNCISKYYVSNGPRKVKKEDTVVFENIWNVENWNLKNVGPNTKITAQGNKSDNTITMNQVLSGTNDWGYPWFIIENTSIFEGTSGITFEVKNTGHINTTGYSGEELQMFLHMKDGRQYLTNYSTPKSSEWKQVVYPWSAFYLFSSPEGMFENKTLELDDIYAISIGTNSADVRTIRNFGVFYSDIESDKLDVGKTLNFSGMTRNGHYEKGSSNLILIAEVPKDEIINIMVFNGRQKIDNFIVEDDKIVIDFTNSERGKYNIQVCAENQYNLQYMNNFSFYIE